VTCTDQETAEVGKEPLITLKTFRSSTALGWDMPKAAVFFGGNIVPKVQGAIHVDDAINVTKRRTTHVAVPSKRNKCPAKAAKPQIKQESQSDMIKGALLAAAQGAAVAVAVAGVLMCFMYYLIKSTAPEAELVKPT